MSDFKSYRIDDQTVKDIATEYYDWVVSLTEEQRLKIGGGFELYDMFINNVWKPKPSN